MKISKAILLLTTLLTAQVTVTSTELHAEKKDWYAHIQTEETNIGMKMNAMEGIDALKIRLSQLIKEHQLELDDIADELLNKEQGLWENWAAARAKLISDTYRGGSHAGLSYSYEMIRLYVQRIEQLHKLKHDLRV